MLSETLHDSPTRSLACFSVSLPSVTSPTTCSVALTIRMTGCYDTMWTWRMPPSDIFLVPPSCRPVNLQSLERWLVRVILSGLPTKIREKFMPLCQIKLLLSLTWWQKYDVVWSRRVLAMVTINSWTAWTNGTLSFNCVYASEKK